MISYLVNFILAKTDLSDSIKIVKQLLSFVLWLFITMVIFVIIIIDNKELSITANLTLGWIGVGSIIEAIVEFTYLRTID